MLSRKVATCAILPLFVLLTGCGGGKKTASANLTGKVLLNGAALPGGTLSLFGNDGGAYTATINAEGEFRMVDVQPGDYTATIENQYLDPSVKQEVYKGGNTGKVNSPAMKGSGAMASKYGGTIGGAGGAPPTQYKGKGVETHIPDGSATVKEGNFVAIPAKFKKKDTSGVKVSLADGDNTKDIAFDGK